jgi:magnesium-transporting ATPase (P-type)
VTHWLHFSLFISSTCFFLLIYFHTQNVTRRRKKTDKRKKKEAHFTGFRDSTPTVVAAWVLLLLLLVLLFLMPLLSRFQVQERCSTFVKTQHGNVCINRFSHLFFFRTCHLFSFHSTQSPAQIAAENDNAHAHRSLAEFVCVCVFLQIYPSRIQQTKSKFFGEEVEKCCHRTRSQLPSMCSPHSRRPTSAPA